jgi:hypothetical protein
MKFVYFNDYRLGAVRDQGVVDLTAVAGSLPRSPGFDPRRYR